MDKKQQEKLLTEIMDADAKDGLYEPAISKMETTQTAVDWYYEQTVVQAKTNYAELLEQAKQMEKSELKKFFNAGFVVQEWDKRKVDFAEQYYNETYNK